MIADARTIVPMIVEALNQLDIPYCFGGSLASSTISTGRMTQDVDFIEHMGMHQADLFAAVLGPGSYCDPDVIREAILHYSMFNIIHYESMFKADTYVPIRTDWEHSQMDRRQLRQIDPANSELSAYMSSAEGVLVQKLAWYRKGNEVSQKQWADVCDLLLIQWDWLDFDYVNLWASRLRVDDLLARALEEVTRRLPPKGGEVFRLFDSR